MKEKQNWIGKKKRWVFDNKQNRVNDKIMQDERKVEQECREKKMGI